MCSFPLPCVGSGTLITPLPFPLNAPGHSSTRHRDAPRLLPTALVLTGRAAMRALPRFSQHTLGCPPMTGGRALTPIQVFSQPRPDPGLSPAPEEAGAAGLRPVGSHEAIRHCLLSCCSLGPDFPGLRLPNRAAVMPLIDSSSAAKRSGTSWSPCRRHRCLTDVSQRTSKSPFIMEKAHTGTNRKLPQGQIPAAAVGLGSHVSGFSCVPGRRVDTAGVWVTIIVSSSPAPAYSASTC